MNSKFIQCLCRFVDGTWRTGNGSRYTLTKVPCQDPQDSTPWHTLQRQPLTSLSTLSAGSGDSPAASAPSLQTKTAGVAGTSSTEKQSDDKCDWANALSGVKATTHTRRGFGAPEVKAKGAVCDDGKAFMPQVAQLPMMSSNTKADLASPSRSISRAQTIQAFEASSQVATPPPPLPPPPNLIKHTHQLSSYEAKWYFLQWCTYIHTQIKTCMHTYIRTYIHT